MAGGLNDYTTNSATTVRTKGLIGLTKTLVSTSQTNTVTPDVTIGERLVYRIRLGVPQGVTTNLVITDLVPRV